MLGNPRNVHYGREEFGVSFVIFGTKTSQMEVEMDEERSSELPPPKKSAKEPYQVLKALQSSSQIGDKINALSGSKLFSSTLKSMSIGNDLMKSLDVITRVGAATKALNAGIFPSKLFESLNTATALSHAMKPLNIGIVSSDFLKSLNATTLAASALKSLHMGALSNDLIGRSAALASLGAGSFPALAGVAALTGHERWVHALMPKGPVGSILGEGNADDPIARMLSVFQLTQHKFDGLASAIEAAGLTVAPSQIQTIRQVVVDSGLHDGSSAPSTANTASNLFLALAQRVSPEIWLQILIGIVLWMLTAPLDYYVKDLLGKASQQEDRRAMAREIAKAIRENDVPPLFLQNRRIAIKALKVHLNARNLSPVVGTIRQGEIVHLEATTSDWALITWRSVEGREMSGWVFRRYVRSLGE
ncbi:hypothetical protein ACSFBF_03550 [Variovorax sp. ZT5P49]|uniref:hypothetical protein n=1 Tax=Variovorax sp. ZT5P49 TaxID=3443733 RepID=UPI003F48C862